MNNSKKQPKRRMGPAGSEVWHSILDGAEEILRDEGYASLTSRNIANRAGLNQQLLYYYFQTMDDLVVALFRRAADRELESLDRAIASGQPLREMWKSLTQPQDNKIVSEFTALSNRNSQLREEVIAFIDDIRAKQLKALQKALKGKKPPVLDVPPEAMVLIGTGLCLALTRDCELGISKGHNQISDMVTQFLQAIEPENTAVP